MRRPRSLATVATVLAGLATIGAGVAYAAFSKTTSNDSNVITGRPDWLAPIASVYTVAKNSGYSAAYVKQGGTYYVYAQVAEPTSNPAAGIATVTADASALTSGQTAAALSTTGGPFTYGGVSYNYRSSLLTAGNPLAAGAKTWSLTSTDAATPTANTATLSSLAVNVDNTVPGASNWVATNKAGGTAGRPEIGDTITFTYNDTIDPDSILSGWTGASTNVTVRITDGGGANDTATIRNTANSAQLPLGSVGLGTKNYVSATADFGPSTAATKSTMVQSGGAITITLGTLASGTATTSAGGNSSWTPSATAYDRAANAASTTVFTQTGNGIDF
jgi:hypothetical protein